jgi:hypothetical protein
MHRVLLMVMAVAAFMCVGTAGAFAGSTPPGKPDCKYGKSKDGKCKPKPCKYGKSKDGKCKPQPPDCKYGKGSDGKCKPQPPDCKYGKYDDGKCKPPPVVVEPPASGPCSQADLVLLEDLLKGTGGLVCLYLGDNSPNATSDRDCPDALLALPLDNLLGACVFLPPVDVDRGHGDDSSSSSPVSGLTGNSGLPALPVSALPAVPAVGSTELQEILSTITSLLKLPGMTGGK